MSIRDRFTLIAFILATLLIPLAAIFSFAVIPLTDDVRVFIGAAHQADLNGLSFPENVDASWELKPLGNKLLWFCLTKLTDLVAPWNKYSVQTGSLLFALLLTIPFMNSVAKYTKGNKDLIYVVILFSVITPFNLFLLQSEWWAVLVSFYVLAYLLIGDHHPGFMAFAGLLSVFIVSLKMSTLFLVPAVVIAYLLIAGYTKKTPMDLVPYFAGFGIGSILGAVLLLRLPNSIPDMLYSISVAHASRGVSFSFVDGVAYFINYTFEQVFALPVLAVGIVSALIIFCVCIMLWINAEDKKEPTIHAMLFIFLWLFPVISIFIQGEFFPYHYMVLAFPAVISILLLGNLVPDHLRNWFYLSAIGIITVFWLLHCSVWSPNYPAQQAFWDKIDADYKMVEDKYHISSQPTLLYLTNQNSPYWWNVPSACRQIGSLPVLYNMTGTKEYDETVHCIENYRGNYVIAVHDMGNTIPPVVGAKIASEMPGKYLPNYTRIESLTNWDIYRRNL